MNSRQNSVPACPPFTYVHMTCSCVYYSCSICFNTLFSLMFAWLHLRVQISILSKCSMLLKLWQQNILVYMMHTPWSTTHLHKALSAGFFFFFFFFCLLFNSFYISLKLHYFAFSITLCLNHLLNISSKVHYFKFAFICVFKIFVFLSYVSHFWKLSKFWRAHCLNVLINFVILTHAPCIPKHKYFFKVVLFRCLKLHLFVCKC